MYGNNRPVSDHDINNHLRNDTARSNRIVEKLKEEGRLNARIGVVKPIQFRKIASIHDYARKRLHDHGISEDDAQKFIDNALVMLHQVGRSDDRDLYVSEDGSSVLLSESGDLINAFPPDENMKELIRRLKEDENQNK